ncbi:MAG TPA: amino acid adenylation domain-containing protein [Candidatus Mucispirillum faecigallinarum]|uniref:Amino acid adenylation domain-containing protein n=1 Tax=Candidatus Mucispirillum faecigallinarum TaxID=2838699 RepID=A0A9D2GWR3_9BACT|nr:amino acid adenylation domain-containing protein [Candidatus Mucispirillum faecigallinarum]
MISDEILNSFYNYSENYALYTDNQYYTYKELGIISNQTAHTILHINNKKQSVILIGSKSFFTYAAMLGIITAGSYYTPLNEIFPLERNINIIKLSKAKILILDYTDFSGYEEILNNINGYSIICPDEHYEFLTNKFTNHTFYKAQNYNNNLLKAEKNDAVYMLFTSGSTGIPKGIKISHENLSNYCNVSKKRNNVESSSKLLQMHDITFDYSVHNIFLSFLYGACLHIINKNIKINPFKYMNEHQITHAAFVPSSLLIMKKMRLLKENSLPYLKYVCFCGETLPFDNALLIAKAAPNAKLENIYGPTEATVACTYFEFNADTKELPEYHGSMPIGKAYDGMEVFLVDNNKNIIDNGIGQIVLSGKQLSKGYVNNQEQTKEKFIQINNKDYYLTGDLGTWVNGELVFLGRNDAQVQIKGYRVELYEIENALSKIDNIISCAVLPAPADAVTYESLTAFITVKNSIDNNEIKIILSQKLPDYMLPNKYIVLDNMPLNANGKIDKIQLKKLL